MPFRSMSCSRTWSRPWTRPRNRARKCLKRCSSTTRTPAEGKLASGTPGPTTAPRSQARLRPAQPDAANHREVVSDLEQLVDRLALRQDRDGPARVVGEVSFSIHAQVAVERGQEITGRHGPVARLFPLVIG